MLKLVEAPEARQTVSGHFRAAKVQPTQVLESRKFLESFRTNLRSVQAKIL